MRKTLIALSLIPALSLANGYILQDFKRFTRGTDGQAKAVRYTSTYNNFFTLHKTGTGQYEIRDSYNYPVGTRQDIDLGGLGELRKVNIQPSYITNFKPYETADLSLTREQKRAFRQDPASYTAQLNQYLAPHGYQASYKLINQKNPRTGAINQVPKLILRKH